MPNTAAQHPDGSGSQVANNNGDSIDNTTLSKRLAHAFAVTKSSNVHGCKPLGMHKRAGDTVALVRAGRQLLRQQEAVDERVAAVESAFHFGSEWWAIDKDTNSELRREAGHLILHELEIAVKHGLLHRPNDKLAPRDSETEVASLGTSAAIGGDEHSCAAAVSSQSSGLEAETSTPSQEQFGSVGDAYPWSCEWWWLLGPCEAADGMRPPFQPGWVAHCLENPGEHHAEIRVRRLHWSV